MKLDYNRDASGSQKFTGKKYEPIPPGVYELVVVGASPKTPKNGGADYLNVAFEVAASEHEGRKVWDMFFLHHANPTACNVSRDRLDDLARACGVFPIADSDELVGHRCVVKLDIEASPGYPPRNKVKHYVEPKAPATGAPAPPPTSPSPSLPDDEIPF